MKNSMPVNEVLSAHSDGNSCCKQFIRMLGVTMVKVGGTEANLAEKVKYTWICINWVKHSTTNIKQNERHVVGKIREGLTYEKMI
jgi:hypothetical protein